MNLESLAEQLNGLLISATEVTVQVGDNATQLFEFGTLLAFAHYYVDRGFQVAPINLTNRNSFRVKTSPRGYPGNYSAIRVENPNDNSEFFIYQNLAVQGRRATDAHFCLDVAILREAIPNVRPIGWQFAANSQLISFAEAKFLKVYPMLVAHFIGIVHELMPDYLSGSCNPPSPHTAPILVSKGNLSENLRAIVDSFAGRGMTIRVENDFDRRLARSNWTNQLF